MTRSRVLGHADALIDAGRWRDALAVLGPHVAASPEDARAWCLIARCHLGLSDPRAARDAAERALALDGDNEWPHRLLSIALARMHSFNAARSEADKAVALAPHFWATHLRRAQVDVEWHGVGERAIAAADRALELAPNEPDAHLIRGLVALHSKDYKRARAEFERTLALDPQNSAARNNLAVVALRRRRFFSAGKHLVGALRLDPQSELFAANLRVVFRGWASVLNVLCFLGGFVVLAGTSGSEVDVANPFASGSPTSLGPDATTPAVRYIGPPVPTEIPASGRPAVLIVVAAVLAATLVVCALSIRRSVGRNAARLVLHALRTDRWLLLTTGESVAVVALVCVAAGVGMPLAHPIAVAVVAGSLGSAVLIRRFVRGRAH